MTLEDANRRHDALREMLQSRGWAEEFKPALNRRIADLEADLCRAENPLSPGETDWARRERQLLIWVRDAPGEILKQISAAARQSRPK